MMISLRNFLPINAIMNQPDWSDRYASKGLEIDYGSDFPSQS